MNILENEKRLIVSKKKLMEKLRKAGKDEDYIQQQISFLYDARGYFSRLEFFLPHISSSDKKHILVSGSAVGMELLIALENGFKKATGVEVKELYKEPADILLENSNSNMIIYDGEHLPFKDNTFSFLQSCHIIEHTKNPEKYLCECIRVLKQGGVFFIEFPDRYHKIELHTGTRSFERYPLPIRNILLMLQSRNFLISKHKRDLYNSVRTTLFPISKELILKWLKDNNIEVDIITEEKPHPGFHRLLLRLKNKDLESFTKI